MARKKQVVEQAEVKKTTKEVIDSIRASRKTKKGREAVAELGAAPDLVVEAPAEDVVPKP